MGYNNKQTSTLEFKDIVLQHIKKILEISSKELKSSERILIIDNTKTYVETEDSRISYIQAIENLAYVLEAHFDAKMETIFKNEIKWIDAFGFEILELEDNKVYRGKLKEFPQDKRDEMLLMLQVKHAKLLFRGLNSLMKRVDYLKSSIFGETSNEDEDILDEVEDEE